MLVCVTLYKYIFTFIYLSGFPRWDIVMRGRKQTSGRVNRFTICYIFVDKIATIVTISADVNYIKRFKTIWKYLLQRYNKENVFYYWLFKGVWDFICDFYLGKMKWGILQLGYSFNQIVSLLVCLDVPLFPKKYSNLFQKPCSDISRLLSWCLKYIKVFLHLSLSAEELFWVIFCPFMCIVTFSMFLYLLRTIQLFNIIFFTNIRGNTQRVFLLKKPF